MRDNKKRCFGNKPGQEFYADYHDNEWGIPVYDDKILFEMLILEGAQAGLSWETVLKKRQAYRRAFHDFEVAVVASIGDSELEELRDNPLIIRNRLKIYSARRNASVFLQIQKERGSFADYLWSFVNNKPIINRPKSYEDVRSTSPESHALSKDLKKRGMNFVGSTIMHAYMQAVGLFDEHLRDCWRASGGNT